MMTMMMWQGGEVEEAAWGVDDREGGDGPSSVLSEACFDLLIGSCRVVWLAVEDLTRALSA